MKQISFNKKLDFLLTLLVVLSASLLLFEGLPLTGYVTESSTISNVTIAKYLAISLGTNLSEGIQFGNVDALPATNINATHNYDESSNGTTYTIDVSSDGNTPVDFCIRADSGLTSPDADVIGIDNETYSTYDSTNSTHPLLSGETAMTDSYVLAPTTGIGTGSSLYWRFWLDIPASQPSGDYNNTVYFKGVVTTLGC